MRQRQGSGIFATVLLVFALVAKAASGDGCHPDGPARIEKLRLAGELDEARSMAERLLPLCDADPALSVELLLELGRIEDRVGLHRNTRPVSAAARHVEAARVLVGSGSVPQLARVELLAAQIAYRAELAGRDFPTATVHAKRAAELFRSLGDRHGEADAIHQLGLLDFQRGELQSARALFERSRDLDREGGERTFFVGEVERHLGFVDLLSNRSSEAIVRFEVSLAARRTVGAIDASLFAATTLASALVSEGRLEEAQRPLLYAQLVAEQLDSPVGRARSMLVSARLFEKAGDPQASATGYRATQRIAESVGISSIVEACEAALQRLVENDPPEQDAPEQDGSTPNPTGDGEPSAGDDLRSNA